MSEVVEVLQPLVRFNTVNPPGNERPAIEYLAARAGDAGLEVTLAGEDPERPNLVAGCAAAADGPTLGCSRTSTRCGADPADWRRDPWSGDVDGRLRVGPRLDRHEVPGRGRGRRRVHARPRRAGGPPGAACCVICVSDEETGGDGARGG